MFKFFFTFQGDFSSPKPIRSSTSLEKNEYLLNRKIWKFFEKKYIIFSIKLVLFLIESKLEKE